MSDDDNSVSSSDETPSMEFNPWLVGGGNKMTYLRKMKDLQHVPGKKLDQHLPGGFDVLVFEGHASREYKEYKRVSYLLQSSRRWEVIGLADYGQARATPEFLSLVVLALSKTNFLTMDKLPFDENFAACLNSGMQTLTHLKMLSWSTRMSHDAAATFANGLALSGSLKYLEISRGCFFMPGAGLELVEGIKENKSLQQMVIDEANLSTVAMKSLLRGLSEGCLHKLVYLKIRLKEGSDCTDALTKLMSSDKCHVETLEVLGECWGPTQTFRTDGIRMDEPNMKLKSLELLNTRFDESFLRSMLPTMSVLSSLTLYRCNISDVSPIVDHLCRPETAIKFLDLRCNQIGIDQAEKLVSSLADMQSLTFLNISENSWCQGWKNESFDKKRFDGILKKVSQCFNLENFVCPRSRTLDKKVDLNLAMNRAWRRELCYKNKSPPSAVLHMVIARALRKTKPRHETDPDLRPTVVFAMLRERLIDLMPPRND